MKITPGYVIVTLMETKIKSKYKVARAGGWQCAAHGHSKAVLTYVRKI